MAAKNARANRTQASRTFGRALRPPIISTGRLTVLVGIAGLAIGAAFAGRRAAMSLSVLMVVGGIALYAIGLAFVEQLGTRLYQAGGLLTALVGLVALYSSYSMDRASQPSGPSRSESGERE